MSAIASAEAQVIGEPTQPRGGQRTVPPGADQVPRKACGVKPRGDHPLGHQHAFGDHQALAARADPARRSTLLRSRKSSTRGSAGSVMSIATSTVAAKALGSTSRDSRRPCAVIRSAACSQQRRRSSGARLGQPLTQPVPAGPAFAVHQLGPGRATRRPAPDVRRRDERLRTTRPRSTSDAIDPGHRRRTDPFAHGQRARRHRALLGQRRERATAGKRDR